MLGHVSQELNSVREVSFTKVESESVRFLQYEPVEEANATEASSGEAWKRWVGVVEGLSGIFEKLIILAALGATAYHMLDVIGSGGEGLEEL